MIQAERMSNARRKVSAIQVAAQLLEDAVAYLAETSARAPSG
jgi:hypothetical protein